MSEKNTLLSATLLLTLFTTSVAQGLHYPPEDYAECIQMWIKRRPGLRARFTDNQIAWMCERTEDWLTRALTPPNVWADDLITPDQQQWLMKLRNCVGIGCFPTLNTAGVAPPSDENNIGRFPGNPRGSRRFFRPRPHAGILGGFFADVSPGELLSRFSQGRIDASKIAKLVATDRVPSSLHDESNKKDILNTENEACLIANVCPFLLNSSSLEDAVPGIVIRARAQVRRYEKAKGKCEEILRAILNVGASWENLENRCPWQVDTIKLDLISKNVKFVQKNRQEDANKELQGHAKRCSLLLNSSDPEVAAGVEGCGSRANQTLSGETILQDIDASLNDLDTDMLRIATLELFDPVFVDILAENTGAGKAAENFELAHACTATLNSSSAPEAFPYFAKALSKEVQKIRNPRKRLGEMRNVQSELNSRFTRWLSKCGKLNHRFAQKNSSFDIWKDQLRNILDASVQSDLSLIEAVSALSVNDSNVNMSRTGRGSKNDQNGLNQPKNKPANERPKRQVIQKLIAPLVLADSGLKPAEDYRVKRKEYRLMSDAERKLFHEAMNVLKNTQIDNINMYDLMVIYHTPEESPGAHWGPAFLPFHRELLRQLEVALRNADGNGKYIDVAIPYWDSTLDQGLPEPRDSVLWTDDFFGNGNGLVTSGPYANWTATHELVYTPGVRKLSRDVGGSQFGGLYREDDLEFITTRPKYEDFTACVDPTFELVHGVVHMYVGGYMADIGISPNDPSFFIHHCFIDYMWEQWRLSTLTYEERERGYPTDEKSCNNFHYADHQMKPFPNKNVEGLKNTYTDNFYFYEPRPSCSQIVPDCGSKYLFCDLTGFTCRSKVKLGGVCTGFDNTEICYNATCRNGRCQVASEPKDRTTSSTPPQIVRTTTLLSPPPPDTARPPLPSTSAEPATTTTSTARSSTTSRTTTTSLPATTTTTSTTSTVPTTTTPLTTTTRPTTTSPRTTTTTSPTTTTTRPTTTSPETTSTTSPTTTTTPRPTTTSPRTTTTTSPTTTTTRPTTTSPRTTTTTSLTTTTARPTTTSPRTTTTTSPAMTTTRPATTTLTTTMPTTASSTPTTTATTTTYPTTTTTPSTTTTTRPPPPSTTTVTTTASPTTTTTPSTTTTTTTASHTTTTRPTTTPPTATITTTTRPTTTTTTSTPTPSTPETTTTTATSTTLSTTAKQPATTTRPTTTTTTTASSTTTTTVAPTTTSPSTTTTTTTTQPPTTTTQEPRRKPPNQAATTSRPPFDVVWFTVTVYRGRPPYIIPVPKATIQTRGRNMPYGYTNVLQGKIVSNSSFPYYSGAAVVQVRSPVGAGMWGIVEASIEATDEFGRDCVVECNQGSECSSHVRLSTNSYYSDPIIFKSTEQEALTAMWQRNGLYRRKIPDYLMFRCN